MMTLDGMAVNRTLVAFFSSTAGKSPTSKVMIDSNTINTIADPVNGMAESLFVSTPDAEHRSDGLCPGVEQRRQHR